MKYEIRQKDVEFLHFLSLPEFGDTCVYPLAVQFRGGVSLLERLDVLLSDAIDYIDSLEDSFHSDENARRMWRFGTVIFSSGEPLLVIIIKERFVTVVANSTVLFKDVLNVAGLREVVREAIKRFSE